MTITGSIARKRANGKRRETSVIEAVKVPSKSRPGLMHFVSPDGKNCSCEAGQYGAPDCSHRRDVRKDSRPYVIEERHDSRLPGSVWCVIQRFTGEVEGVYTSVAEAYWTLWALEERGS